MLFRSRDTIAGLDMATRHYGLTMNDAGEGLKYFTNLIGDANNGSKTAEATLTRLFGSDWKSKTRNMNDALAAAFSRINGLPDDVSRGNAALDVFGEQGYRLIPIINEVGGSVDAMRKKARDASLEMSGDDVVKAREFTQGLQGVEDKARSVGLTFGRELAEPITHGLDDINQALDKNKGTIKSWAEETGNAVSGLIWLWQQLYGAMGGTANGQPPADNGVGRFIQRHPILSWMNPAVGAALDYLEEKGRGSGPWSTDQGEDPRYVTTNPDWFRGPYFTGDKPGKQKAPKKEHVLSPEAKTIMEHATTLGISPLDYATLLLYEGAGSLSTSQWGGKGNKYLGPMQMGPWEQKHYGVKPGMSLDSYLDAGRSEEHTSELQSH